MKSASGALVPADAECEETIRSFKIGQGVRMKASKCRSLPFHRKAFALFQLAFDIWEPPADHLYKGEPIAKDFDRFRKDVTITAGFYRSVFNLRGEVRLEAESLNWASMDEVRFQQCYRAVLNVVWQKILKDSARYQSPEAVEAVVERLLRFE